SQHVEQPLASNAEAIPAQVSRRFARAAHFVLVPAVSNSPHRAGALRALPEQVVEQFVHDRDTPAVRDASWIAFENGDVSVLVGEPRQDREIQSCGPTADADDFYLVGSAAKPWP